MTTLGDSEATAPGRVYKGRSAQQRREDRLRRLRECALELFGTEGYAATPIEKLCTQANVSTRSFYDDMGSREALLITVVDEITTKAAAAAYTALLDSRDLPLSQRIGRGLRAYLSVTCASAQTAKVCYVELIGVSSRVEEFRTAWRRRMTEMIADEADRAAASGEIEPRDYHLFALCVIGAVNSLGQELAATPSDTVLRTQVSLDDIIAELAHLIAAGSQGPR